MKTSPDVRSAEEVTIRSLAELVRDRSGSASPIKPVPYAEAYEEGFEDLARRVPDLTKIAKAIGFRHSKTLAEIVDAVIAYHGQDAANAAAQAT